MYDAAQMLSLKRAGCALVCLAWLVGAGCRTTSTLRLQGYYDTRELATGTLTGTVIQPRLGTRLFGFQDYGPGPSGGRYLEMVLSQPLYHGLGLLTEYNREFRNPRGTNRFGVMYQPKLSGPFRRDRLQLKMTPFSTHDVGSQWGFSGMKNLWRNGLMEGYFEYNPKSDRVVTEWQYVHRIRKPFALLAEFRHNGMKRRSNGVGLGVEWTIK